jgi:hypothetical protein
MNNKKGQKIPLDIKFYIHSNSIVFFEFLFSEQQKETKIPLDTTTLMFACLTLSCTITQ